MIFFHLSYLLDHVRISSGVGPKSGFQIVYAGLWLLWVNYYFIIMWSLACYVVIFQC